MMTAQCYSLLIIPTNGLPKIITAVIIIYLTERTAQEDKPKMTPLALTSQQTNLQKMIVNKAQKAHKQLLNPVLNLF